MTKEREPAPELTTSRVRGGPSPWLVAVVALAALGSVVYVGISGNIASPDHSVKPAFVAAAASPTPDPTPLTLPGAQFPSQPGAPEIADGVVAPRPHSYLGIGLDIGGDLTLALLSARGPNQLHAAYRVPLPALSDTASLELVNVVDDRASYTSGGQWTLRLNMYHGGVSQDSIVDAYAPTVLVSDSRAPDPLAGGGAPQLTRNGYSIQITGQRQDDSEILDVNLTIGPDQVYPNEILPSAPRAGAGQ